MTVSTLAALASSLRQRVLYSKTAIGGSAQYTSSWTGTGTLPAAGGSAGDTTNGAVPTSTTTGAPAIHAFSGAGIVTGIDFFHNLGGRFYLYDRVFHCGAFSGNASASLSSQPSFSSRMPGGSYVGTQLWFEAITSAGGTPNLTITYTDQSGNTGHSTNRNVNSNTAGVATLMQLAAGDSGVQTVESVAMTGATGGTWNVLILRPVLGVSIDADGTVSLTMEETGAPQVWSDSCLMFAGLPATSSSQALHASIEIASG